MKLLTILTISSVFFFFVITVNAYPSPNKVIHSTFTEEVFEYVEEDRESINKISTTLHNNKPSYSNWVENLDIEEGAKEFDERLEREQREKDYLQRHQHRQDSGGLWFSFTNWFKFIFHWISNILFGVDMFVEIDSFTLTSSPSQSSLITTKYTDSTPRFVAYGDAYVESNGFGIPHPSQLQGFTHYNIAFWLSSKGAVDNVAEWITANETIRKAIVNAYNKQGIRLGISVFGETDRPLSKGNDPIKLAKKIASFIKQYNLQGVDIDFEEFNTFSQKKATKWLIPLTRTLRNQLPLDQFYISHAPIAPLFNSQIYPLGYTWIEKDIGNLIDFYNIQFYNQQDYSTCQHLVINSQQEWPNTALLQLNSIYNIPMDKIVVGKPATKADAGNGYMSAQDLGECLAQYAIPKGWKAGCMWWEYQGNLQGILNPVKQLTGL